MSWNDLLKQLEHYKGTLYLEQPIYVYDNEGNEIPIDNMQLIKHEGEDPRITQKYFLTLNKHPQL